jgi:hypothetical protein
MSGWNAEWMEEFTKSKEWKRYQRRLKIAGFMTNWMRHIPVIGDYVASFWFMLIDDGIMTLKPRWGGVTFGYLNDGIRPTVWHTWRQMTHDQDDPYTGIYTMGAPRSLAQAEEWELKWEKEREQRANTRA